MIPNRLIIAVDFDGTITTEPDMSKDKKLTLRENCKKVLEVVGGIPEVTLVLWTCRTGDALSEALDFLNEKGLLKYFEYVNEQDAEITKKYHPEIGPKVGADLYIDDKAYMGDNIIDWVSIAKHISQLLKDISVDVGAPQAEQALPALPDNSKLPYIFSVLSAVQYDKEKGYGSSWKARGEHRGIMPNIDRKYDRLDKMTNDELQGKIKSLIEWEKSLKDDTCPPDEIPESKIDAIADLTNYSLLYMTYVKDNFPLMFNAWVEKNVPKYLRDGIDQ
jgi:hypothetical protein